MNDNTCIVCGRIIPEGRHVCLHCEGQNEMQTFKDVTHERRGSWKLTEKLCKVMICSCCQGQTNSLYNFCPNCGAKMNGGA